EEEARMMVYSAGSGLSAYNAFGTLLSDELYHRVEGIN
ncbi:hypothetical protein A2U01_0044815, partial [Trifolium medium]|nr:hypothetical protein [Trifolium medium]